MSEQEEKHEGNIEQPPQVQEIKPKSEAVETPVSNDVEGAKDETSDDIKSDDVSDADTLDDAKPDNTPDDEPEKPSPFMKQARLTTEQFEILAKFIDINLGIKMPDKKKTMLEARLRKRLRFYGFDDYTSYMNYLFSDEGFEKETIHMLDVVTTNKTDFFREPRHFTYLSEEILPKLIKEKAGAEIKIWSAACSSGEEPYTIAMVMKEYEEKNKGKGDELKFSITGTDVCVDVLYKAHDAVYKEERIEPIEEKLKKKYILRSKNTTQRQVRIVKELRDLVTFKRVNFMDEDFELDDDYDIVFCRNAMIYFERSAQELIIGRICKYIRPGGWLIMGHSETLMGIDVPLTQEASTIYRRN